MLTGYCIRPGGAAPPAAEWTGIDGAPLLRVEAGGFGLWVSKAPLEEAPSEARIREHDAVVRLALRDAPALPMRFGTRFHDEAAAERGLREGAPAFGAALERVAGRVEMGLRVLWAEADTAAPEGGGVAAGSREPTLPAGGTRSDLRGAGRRFLERRRAALRMEGERRERAERLLEKVDRACARDGVLSLTRLSGERGVAGALTHLIEPGDVPAYRRRVAEAQRGLREAELVVTGPFAPYSFV